LHDGFSATEIGKMQELQQKSLALLTTMAQQMIFDGLRKNVIINFNGSGDEGYFELDPLNESASNHAK
jgi:hypothetical protein